MGRVLLLPHAPTGGLAHLGACLAVGGELRRRGHEVEVAYGGTRTEVIEREGLRWHRVPEIAAEREWYPRDWYASEDELRSFVTAHLELIDRVRPDVAVSSSGTAGRLACEVAGVPQLHLMHSLAASPYGNRVGWGDRLRVARRPLRSAATVRARIRAGRRRAVGPSAAQLIERIRQELGLAPTGPDVFAGARDSIVALTTTPFLDPGAGLPDHWRYVGPLAWSAAPAAGPEARKRAGRPLVYVSQGSTGDPRLLRRAVADLARRQLDVVVTTGGLCDPSELAALGSNVMAADLLPGLACLAAADAAVIHGGHLTFCQALLTGTPFVMLPFRNDQIGRLARTERLGVGIGLWPRPRLPGTIGRAVARLLEMPDYRQRSAALAGRLRKDWDGLRTAADLVEELGRGKGRAFAGGEPR